MTTGVISLAVPLSTTFAGEFLILAGVFQQGWGWAVVGAVAIVLAAMYMLRADLGRAAPGRRAGGAATPRSTCALGELAVVVPLVALPARPLGLAEPDLRPRVRRNQRRAGRREPCLRRQVTIRARRLHHDEREHPCAEPSP